MRTTRTYLDYNATAPVHDAVRDAVAGALAMAGNPSSTHREGREARRIVEAAREAVARLVRGAPEDVVFTSGGTEANNLAITSALATGAARRVIVSAVEHPSVLEAARGSGAPVDVVPVDAEGTVDLDALARLLAGDDTPALVCLMHANNETGAIQPVVDAARVARAHGAMVHVDAVQTVGRLPVELAALGADSLALSSHKIGGPAGSGALVLRSGVALAPMIRGGGQERGRRSGTENLPGIAGFAAASEIALSHIGDTARIGALRDRLEQCARSASPDLRVWSAGVERLVNTTCFSVPGTKAETLVIALDLAGVAVSSGSACSSGKVAASHVLAAMGVPRDDAAGAVRASLGWGSTSDDVDRFADAWTRIMAARSRKRDIAA